MEFKQKKLRKMLIDRGLTSVQLAEQTGVTRQYVNQILNGSNGSVGWWRKAAEVLGCDIADIVE